MCSLVNTFTAEMGVFRNIFLKMHVAQLQRPLKESRQVVSVLQGS